MLYTIKILEEFGLRIGLQIWLADLHPPKNCSEKQILTLWAGAEGAFGWFSLRLWNKPTGAR